MDYVVFGQLLPAREVITARDANILVWIARHGRLSRVHRRGRRGRRGWVFEPRNKAEQCRRKSLISKRHW